MAHAVPSQQFKVSLIAMRNGSEYPINDSDLRAMLKEDGTDGGAAMKACDESDHAAKVRAEAILSRTYHGPTAVHWPDHETKAEAFALAGNKLADCPSCNIDVINYLRHVVGLHPITKEVAPALHRQRLDTCRGNERKGIPRCEHLAWPGLNCGLCLCFIDAKSRMKSMKCPDNRWKK